MIHQTILRISKIVFGIILFLSISTAFSANSAEIKLQDAIRTGLVEVKISGNSLENCDAFISSYYGPCLLMAIQSKTKKDLNIRLEAGLLLETSDSSEQRMIVTQEEMIVLLSGKKKSLNLFAMCTQMHDRSPGIESLLAPGPMADGNLLLVAQFLSKNKFQSLAAQEAIWVLTDNNDIGSIYSDNQEETNKLQAFICKLTGKTPPPAPHRISYANGMVSGQIIFSSKRNENYSLIMMNEAGEKIGTFFENKSTGESIETTLTWRFRFNGFPSGVYYVKLRNARNEVIVSRPVVIN